jgi:predicted lipid-binding transport protein (Tim44 family)
MRIFSGSRLARAALALTAVVALGIAAADARPGGGGNSGSRGSKTFSAPPATATAPKAAQPMQRSQPAMAAPAAAGKSRFGSGFGGMLMGGLLGAGLFGLLSGSGLFGGLSGLAGFLGLLLQVALIGGIAYLAIAFFRSRSAQPAMASAPAAGAPAGMLNRETVQRAGMTSAAPAAGGYSPPPTVPVELSTGDYESFEQLLAKVQDAYGREDEAGLRRLVTPEMHSYFGDEIQANRSRNVHNLTSDAKLLQGDLSEAWAEDGYDYATVAMRYSLLETTVERGTGRVLSGDSSTPIEATELWTFVRRGGSGAGGWQLSAIQQVD